MDEARRKKPVKYRQPERSEMKRRLNRKIIIIMELSPLLHSKPPSISIRSLVATKKMDLINTCILCWTHEILISWFRFWCGVLKNCVCYSSETFSSFFSCSLSSCIHLVLESCEAYYFMWNQHRIFCA